MALPATALEFFTEPEGRYYFLGGDPAVETEISLAARVINQSVYSDKWTEQVANLAAHKIQAKLDALGQPYINGGGGSGGAAVAGVATSVKTAQVSTSFGKSSFGVSYSASGEITVQDAMLANTYGGRCYLDLSNSRARADVTVITRRPTCAGLW